MRKIFRKFSDIQASK